MAADLALWPPTSQDRDAFGSHSRAVGEHQTLAVIKTSQSPGSASVTSSSRTLPARRAGDLCFQGGLDVDSLVH